MNDLVKICERCLTDMKVDYVPLHDIVREFSGYINSPTREDFINALNVIECLVIKYDVKVLEGPDMKKLENPLDEIISWLKEIWDTGNYETIDYGIWFNK